MVVGRAVIGSAIAATPVHLDHGPLDGEAEPMRAVFQSGDDFSVRQELDRMAPVADQAAIDGLLP